MKHTVNPAMVERATKDILRTVGNGSMVHGEAVLALSEALGRMIVEVCKTPIQMIEMANIADAHLRRTIHVGAQAKGFRGTQEEKQ